VAITGCSNVTTALPICRWHALLLVMDNRPFPDLRHIVRDANDDRIQVFAEWVSLRALHTSRPPYKAKHKSLSL